MKANQSISILSRATVNFAQNIYGQKQIPLHRPMFEGEERQYLVDCVDSNFVSSVGAKVTEFEETVAEFTGSGYGIATVNGTSALHAAILVSGVKAGEEVITQALTFVATSNAIAYAGALPVFIDVDIDTMGLSPAALNEFLDKNAEKRSEERSISCRKPDISLHPMHTFGLPCRIAEIAEICVNWGIILIEDAAESLGSYVGARHTGTFGRLATLSFNGNKIITCGAGE